MPQTARTAKRTTNWEFQTLGCVVQLVGVALLFVFPFGTIVGAFMVLLGNGFGPRSRCGACRSLLPSREAVVCAACGAELTDNQES